MKGIHFILSITASSLLILSINLGAMDDGSFNETLPLLERGRTRTKPVPPGKRRKARKTPKAVSLDLPTATSSLKQVLSTVTTCCSNLQSPKNVPHSPESSSAQITKTQPITASKDGSTAFRPPPPPRQEKYQAQREQAQPFQPATFSQSTTTTVANEHNEGELEWDDDTDDYSTTPLPTVNTYVDNNDHGEADDEAHESKDGNDLASVGKDGVAYGSDSDSDIDEETELAVQHYIDSWTYDTSGQEALKLANRVKDDPKYAHQLNSDFQLKTGARKAMTDGIHLYLKSNQDAIRTFAKTKDTTLQSLKEGEYQNKQTKLLIDYLKFTQKLQRRLEACRFITKSGVIQPDAEILTDYYNACEEQEKQEEDLMKSSFDLGLHNMKRSKTMRNRIFKIMSQTPAKIVHETQEIDSTTLFEQLVSKTKQGISATDTEAERE